MFTATTVTLNLTLKNLKYIWTKWTDFTFKFKPFHLLF